mgnify:CR=1 FL=1
MHKVPCFSAPSLSMLKTVHHGFFGRESQDHNSQVCELFGLECDRLVMLQQQHTDIVHVVHQPFTDMPIGDALITMQPNLMLAIRTADCAPVLLADPVKKIVAAVHAGWRGAVKGILETTVQKMVELGAGLSDLCVAIGPCIWQSSYEIGPDFIESMKSYPGAFAADFFIKSEQANHFYFDLPGYVQHRLLQAGVKAIDPSPFDTYANPDRFFSYRYETLKHLPATGRQLSVICLKD